MLNVDLMVCPSFAFHDSYVFRGHYPNENENESDEVQAGS